jgi:H+/Cl- antiporter ClcA
VAGRVSPERPFEVLTHHAVDFWLSAQRRQLARPGGLRWLHELGQRRKPGASARSAGPSAGPAALLRSARYLRLLALATLLGVPISAAAYGFLALVALLQDWVYADLPRALGLTPPPWWWPAPPLVLAGLLVGPTIRFLPGRGGKSPTDGFSESGPPPPSALPGIALAALAGLSMGAVIGPEAPLIALGSGLAACAVRLTRRAGEPTATAVIGATGSFAAVSTLLGSPLLGAFLLMEVSGLGGAMLGLVLLPGLLAAGLGSLIFIGLGTWTGLGTFSLALPGIPGFAQPDLAQFGWAVAIGVTAAALGSGVRWLALRVRPFVEPRPLVAVPLAGLVVAALAIGYAAATGHAVTEVLFSGQDALGPLLTNSAGYSVGTLLLLLAAKGLATPSRRRRSAVARSSPRCSSARHSGWCCRTCRACPWWPARRWASGRCPW